MSAGASAGTSSAPSRSMKPGYRVKGAKERKGER